MGSEGVKGVPSVGGVLETSLYVEDLPRSIQFYESIFDFEKVSSDERLCALNVGSQQVLLLFKKGASKDRTVTPPHDGSGELHLAFSIAASALESWERWLLANGVTIESKHSWQRNGVSLYFRDPDRHLVELATPGIWSIY